MKGNGWVKHATARGNKFGLMAQFMRAIGLMTRPTAMVDCTTQMVTHTRGCGRTTKPTGMEFTPTPTARNTMENGKMTNSTGLEKRNGLTTLFIRACMQKARKMDKES